MSNTPNVVFEFGPFRVEPARRLLLRDGEPVPLPGRTFDVLSAMLERAGRVVTNEELMEIVWHGKAVEPNNLTVAISKARSALGEKRPHFQYIANRARVGYQFIAEVRKSFEKPQAAAFIGGYQPHKGGAVPMDST